MPSRSRFASRSSTSFAVGALAGGLFALLGLRRREPVDDERVRLAGQLITAEQDERRRLSVALHDGPLQALSGIVLMHDAALSALREGRLDEAASLLGGSIERERATIHELRDLSSAMEPVILRDQSFEAAVQQLADQLESSRQIEMHFDVLPGDRLGEKAQVALYQVLREALNQAASRKPRRIDARVAEIPGGGYEASVRDDGVTERRRASVEAIEERARLLGARVSVSSDQAGTLVRVDIPAYVAGVR